MNKKRTVVIGTRKSLLAMAQAKRVLKALKTKFPKLRFVIKGIITKGDRQVDLTKAKDKGLFIKELEKMLIGKKIDIAVHSMKDIPVDIPKQLKIAAITKRLDARDVIISRSRKNLNKIALGSRIGTSSLRRKVQVRLFRPDLQVIDIRGNLDTRLKKLKSGKYDAIIVAGAGLLRLGWQKYIAGYIPFEIMLPPPGQGALGIQIRESDAFIKEISATLDHEKSRIEITAERAFLSEMGGGCRMPMAAFGEVKGKAIKLRAVVAKAGSALLCRDSLEADKNSPELAGIKLAQRIKKIMIKKGKKGRENSYAKRK
ncbi:MAG: hydroxymethylbilane synthase [Candidatus Omnitrophica bacterium]|nr:hydroxymethylbilane synthase [Candidatus Omnitrophota bacterium]